MRIAEEKDPGDVIDYGFDWTPWLRGIDGNEDDTVVSSTWVVPSPLTTPVPSNHTSKMTLVWLGAGDPGSTYTVTNHIVTAAGRHGERSLVIPVKQL